MTEIDQFRLVLAVARTHSIREVALYTGLSQPTVTRAVAATERLVGYRLFERTADGTVPTDDAGRAFRLIEEVLAAYDALAGLDGAQPGTVRLAHRPDAVPTTVNLAVNAWNRIHPVPATLIETTDPVALLQAGDAEFAVVEYTGPYPDGIAGEPVLYIRSERIDLLHATPPSPAVTAFLKHLG